MSKNLIIFILIVILVIFALVGYFYYQSWSASRGDSISGGSKDCLNDSDCIVFGKDGDCNCGCYNKENLPSSSGGECFCAVPDSCKCIGGLCQGVFEEISESDISELALYRIEFVADWSKVTHPNDYPANAHFSPFVAYSHNSSSGSVIFKEGQVAIPGMEEMAETGKTKILAKEIDDIIGPDNTYTRTQGKRFDSPGTDSATLKLVKDYSYMTFVSMVAPSPDWFVAQTVNLIEDGNWIDKIELPLITYDAGTDSGSDFTSEDIDTNPKEPITVFPENLQGLGRVILTKMNN